MTIYLHIGSYKTAGWYDDDGEYRWKESGIKNRFCFGKIYSEKDFMFSIVLFSYGFTLII